MDLESESSVPESVKDNEEIKNFVVHGESSSQNNGFHDVENSGENEVSKEINEMRYGVLGSSNSHPVEMKPEASPSPTSKGFGLKKWKRIRRDVSKVREGSVETGKMESRDIPNSGGSSSKRAQVYIEKNQKTEGSASSTNAVVKNLDGFGFIDDSALPNGPLFATGTDSENSEDLSSKSTAASAPNVKYERPLAVGIRISGGKNVTHSAHRSQQGKVKTETTKKAKGDRAKIEKENSYSSMESDSRSSDFVFVQGIHSPNNGIRSRLSTDYDGDNEVQGAGRQVSDGHLRDYSKDGAGGYEDSSPDDLVANSTWNAKEEICNNHGSTMDQDPLIEPTFLLQAVQEALEKEVLKFKEISKNVEQELQETSSVHVPSDESIDVSSEAVQSEVLEAEKELEELYRQKIEVEVEYLTISRKVQSLRVSVEEEQKVPKILDKSVDTEKSKDEKLDTVLEDFVSADETLKLQKRVCKYTSCFFMQLVLLVGIFFFQLSPNYEGEDIVPT